MAYRFTDAIAPDLGAILAAAIVLGGGYAVWAATAKLTGAPHDIDSQFATLDGGAGPNGEGPGPSESKTETTAADGGVKGGTVATPRATRTYNVILISVDTLRADLGYAGYPRPVSTNIDELAKKSVVFERAYAMASFTPKCLGPLMIGKYSSETIRDYEHYTKFGADNLFLAERLHNAGNRTAAAMCHRYFGWKKGLDQGFDIWDVSSVPPNSIDNDPRETSEKMTNTAIAMLDSKNAADIPLKDGKPIGGKPNGRFFAWFHYLDPHLPYTPHEGAPNFATMGPPGIPSQRAGYDGDVWYTDKWVGKLLQYIAAQPWANETAILFTADHGEAFGEHNHWGHGRELWEPLVHVPLMLQIPGVPPHWVKNRRSHVDVVPTVLDLMGVANDDPTLHGKSLAKDAMATGPLEDHDIYIDMPDGPYNDMRRSVITGPGAGLKLIEMQGGRSELYDLNVDPRELKNISTDAAKMKEAKDAMAKVRSTLKELPPKPQ